MFMLELDIIFFYLIDNIEKPYLQAQTIGEHVLNEDLKFHKVLNIKLTMSLYSYYRNVSFQ